MLAASNFVRRQLHQGLAGAGLLRAEKFAATNLQAASASDSTASCCTGHSFSTSSSCSTGELRSEQAGGLPENTEADGEQGVPNDEAEVEGRKSKTLRYQMATDVLETDPALAQLLQRNGVIVRGGAEQARKLMQELLEWRKGSHEKAE